MMRILTKTHTYGIIMSVVEEPEGGWQFPPRGGDCMPITITFHIRNITVTIRIKVKSNNRHSGK